MRKIRIILEITDPEIIDDYNRCDESFVVEDILNGGLLNYCTVVAVEKFGL